MAALGTAVFALLFGLACYAMVRAKSTKAVTAVTLMSVLCSMLVNPQPAEAQGSLVGVINSVLNTINGVVKTALTEINTVRSSNRNLYQQIVWSVPAIEAAKSHVVQTVRQYRAQMQGLLAINLKSASLPTPIALENAIRNHQTNDFAGLTAAYRGVFGALPSPSAASPADLNLMDMDDTLSVANLKTLKSGDAAGDLTEQAANQIEDAAGQAAPGSAPFLTASAIVASVRSQALTQRMLAAQLRQRAGLLAHLGALRKRDATLAQDVNTDIQNLLKRK